MREKIATTVKIDPDLYDDFKILCVRSKVTLQNLVEKTIFRYVKDEVFRNDMNSYYAITSSVVINEVTSSIF